MTAAPTAGRVDVATRLVAEAGRLRGLADSLVFYETVITDLAWRREMQNCVLRELDDAHRNLRRLVAPGEGSR